MNSTTKYIGFTTQYYTLWEVTTDGKYFYYNYKQNLSKDLDKAKAKQPTAIVDLSLRGHHSFKTEYIPTDCFQFGKYKGTRFAECEDIEYMQWYHNACKDNDKLQKNVRPILADKGYKLWNNKLMLTDTQFAEQEKMAKYFPIFQAKIDAHQSFKFNCLKNVLRKFDEDSEEEYGLLNIPFCKLCFPTIAQQTYKDVTYYLPTINDIPTRIKGNVVVIDEYSATLIDDMLYQFDVLKFHVEFKH